MSLLSCVRDAGSFMFFITQPYLKKIVAVVVGAVNMWKGVWQYGDGRDCFVDKVLIGTGEVIHIIHWKNLPCSLCTFHLQDFPRLSHIVMHGS